MAKAIRLRCPTCKKAVRRTEAEYPFCSQRCRTIDLGKWASGAYVISTPINQADQSGEADYVLTPRTRPTQAAAAKPARAAEFRAKDTHGKRERP